MATKKIALPTSVASAADKLYTLREKRYALQKQVDALEAEESALRDFLIEKLPASKASGITGRIAHVEIKKKTIAQVSDWPTFYKFILKTKDFSLLQRRINDAAVQERWAAKKTVPGTKPYNTKVVSVTKK